MQLPLTCVLYCFHQEARSYHFSVCIYSLTSQQGCKIAVAAHFRSHHCFPGGLA
jgi:hypothetical protein